MKRVDYEGECPQLWLPNTMVHRMRGDALLAKDGTCIGCAIAMHASPTFTCFATLIAGGARQFWNVVGMLHSPTEQAAARAALDELRLRVKDVLKSRKAEEM